MKTVHGWEKVNEDTDRLRAGDGWLYRVRTRTTTTLKRKIGGSNESGMFPSDEREVGNSTVERVTVTFVPEARSARVGPG